MAGYLVKYGDEVIFGSGLVDRPIHDANLGMMTETVSTFTFTMPSVHPLRNGMELHDFANPVRVWFDDELLFTGFITRVVENINTELVVTCVSDLQLLANVHARIDDHPQGNGKRRVYTAPQLFKMLIDYYNGLVPEVRQFTIGHTIGASDVGYYDSQAGKTVVDAAASTPTGILDILSSSILDPYDCMLRVWYSGSTRYIGLYTAAPTTNSQRIEFGYNMTEFAMDVNTDNLYNGCMPVGGSRRNYKTSGRKDVVTTGQHYGLDENTFYIRSTTGRAFSAKKGDILVLGDGEYQFAADYTIKTTQTEVTVEGTRLEELAEGVTGYWLKRGADYTNATLTLERAYDGTYETDFRKVGELVYNVASVDRYGLRTFTFSDSDIILTADLLSKAIAEMRKKLAPTMTLSVNGVDMALYMEGYTHLVAGQKVRVVSVPHNVDTTMQVTQASLSLDNPGATRYTIGPVPKTATKRTRDVGRDTTDVRDMLTYDINNVITGSQIMGLR